MSKHTPGPWIVEDPLGNGPGDHLWIVQEGASPQVYDWRNLAVVCSDDPNDCENDRPITADERDANARLIAAAPELLSIIERFVALPCEAWHPERHAAEEEELMTEARAAISAARGESQ